MAVVNTNIFVVTLNVSEQDTLIKILKFSYYVKQKHICVYKLSFKNQDTENVKAKEQEGNPMQIPSKRKKVSLC